MSFQALLFYALSALLLTGAGLVVSVRNPVHAALSLVLCFFASAGLWLLLEAEFLAITLVLVYVGAVMVLFLFVVMMLDINVTRMREGFIRFLPLGTVVAVLSAAFMILVVSGPYFGLEAMPAPPAKAADYSNTAELGRQLYTTYVYPFEIAAVVLLVAIVAAITLTLRRRPNTRFQEPSLQVQVRRADRVRLVSMSAEERK